MPGPPPGAGVLEDADLLDDEDAAGAADEEEAAGLEAGLAAGVELEEDAAGVEAAAAELDLADVLLELELAANQVSTPLWPLQAPDLVGEVV